MSHGSTLYRFKISLSDSERDLDESLDFRLSRQASESVDYLLTRVLAYTLSYERGLEFSGGLATPDEPSIWSRDAQGGCQLWIDIGNPSARRMHLASKASERVKIYTYKNPEGILIEAKGQEIYQAQKIEVFSFDRNLISGLEGILARDNSWNVIIDQGEVIVVRGEDSFMSPILSHRLK
jgi:uncharacterized protein YaeQ